MTQSLEGFDFAHRQIAACDAKIEAYMAQLQTQATGDSSVDDRPRHSRRKNQPHFILPAELVRIAGVDLRRAFPRSTP